jgi:short-subunit dehydrogenase
MRVSGRHVLVTGGSQGIGVDIAAEFSRRGARVTVLGRDVSRLGAVAERIGGAYLQLDLADGAAVVDVVSKVEALSGPIDVLINNAGVAITCEAADYRAGDAQRVMMINTVAPMELTRQVLPGMTERRRGHIVNISSWAGVAAVPHLAVYGASKAALHHYTAVVQRELAVKRLPVGMTLVTLGEVAGTKMMEDVRNSPVIAAVSERLAHSRALPNISPADVASAIAHAVERNSRYVSVPRRISPIIHLRDVPSRLQDLLLRGVSDSPGGQHFRDSHLSHNPIS